MVEASQLLRRPGHPSSSSGLFCGSSCILTDLIPLLVSPGSRNDYWEHAMRNVQNCIKCALRYHQTVDEWESSAGSEDIIGRTKESLLAKDEQRLIECLNNPVSHSNTKRIEIAVYEIFASVDLAMRTPLTRALDRRFGSVKRVVLQHAATPAQRSSLPGSYSDANYGKGETQACVLRAISSLPDPHFHLGKAVDKAIEYLRSRGMPTDTGLRTVCAGLTQIMEACPLEKSHFLFWSHRQARSALLDIIDKGLSIAVAVAAKLLLRLLRAYPSQVWNKSPALVLRSIRSAFDRVRGQNHAQICVLELYSTIVELLPQMELSCMCDLMEAQLDFLLRISSGQMGKSVQDDAVRVYRRGRAVAARVMLHGYTSCAPVPPFKDADGVFKLVDRLLRDKVMTDQAIAISAEILLSDALNLLRAVAGKRLGVVLIRELRKDPLRIVMKEDVDRVINQCLRNVWQKDWVKYLDTRGPVPWMASFWDRLYKQKSLTPYPSNVQRGLGSILLEAHRVVGLLSPSGSFTGNEMQHWQSSMILEVVSSLQCLSKVQQTVERFLTAQKFNKQHWWAPRLAYHSGHIFATQCKPMKFAACVFMQNVMGVNAPKDKMFHISVAFRKDPECTKHATKGILVTSRVLSAFNVEQSFDEQMCHLVHYTNALRAELAACFEDEEGAQAVIFSFLMNIFARANQAQSLTHFQPWMKRILKGLCTILDHIQDLGDIDIYSEMLTALAQMMCKSRDLRHVWVETVIKIAAKVHLSKSIKSLYVDAIDDPSRLLDPEQCVQLAKGLNLSENTLRTVQAWKRRGTREALSSIVARRIPLSLPKVLPPKILPPVIPGPKPSLTKNNLGKFKSGAREKAEMALQMALGRETSAESKTPPAEEAKRLYPLTLEERKVSLRWIDAFHIGVLRPVSDARDKDRITTMPSAFPNTEAYVKFWTPLLLKETRASVMQDVDAERSHFGRAPERDRRFIRAPFVLHEAIYRGKDMTKLVIKFNGGGDIRTFGRDVDVDNQFKACGMQIADILRFEISTNVDDTDQSNDIFDALGVVIKADVGRREAVFTVHTLSVPGFPFITVGHRVWATRVTNLVSHQRQIEALWSAHCLPERMLRTMLRPDEGWAMAKGVKNDHIPIAGIAVKRLQELGVLNPSQAAAVNVVVHKTGKLDSKRFANYGRATHSVGKSCNSSLTLIQGPPGTGKTTTILSMLSTLLSNSNGVIFNRMRMEKVKNLGDVSVAPFRVLVCAPSNAAVDEILKRTMQKGLPMPNGHYASPRVVRIGARSSIDVSNQVELKTLARLDPDWTSSKSVGEKENSGKLKQIDVLLREVQSELDEAFKAQKETRGKFSECKNSAEHSNLCAVVQKNSDVIDSLKKRRNGLRDKITFLRDQENNSFQERNNNNIRALAKVLNGASIVFSTLNGSASDSMSHLIGSFDVVIVDEAAQCVEPDILIPLSGRCTKVAGPNNTGAVNGVKSPPLCRHIVLVGDPSQLPATVISNDETVQSTCGKSFFERAAESPLSEVHLLNVQYRMHPAICQFPSTQFYDGRLICGDNVKKAIYHKPYHFDLRKRFGPVTFFDTTSCLDARETQTGSKSLFNGGEARLVVMALLALFRLYPKEQLLGEVAVLSPYSAQVREVKRMIRREMLLAGADIEVSTVDGIQGREKSIVILSTVRDSNGSIGFVKDPRRMNVGLTRAQHAVIVVGSALALSGGSKHWASFVGHCNQKDQTVRVSSLEELFPEARSRFVNLPPVMASELPDLSVQDWERRPALKKKLDKEDEFIVFDEDKSIVEERAGVQRPSLDINAVVPLRRSRTATPSPTEDSEMSLSRGNPEVQKAKPGMTQAGSSVIKNIGKRKTKQMSSGNTKKRRVLEQLGVLDGADARRQVPVPVRSRAPPIRPLPVRSHQPVKRNTTSIDAKKPKRSRDVNFVPLPAGRSGLPPRLNIAQSSSTTARTAVAPRDRSRRLLPDLRFVSCMGSKSERAPWSGSGQDSSGISDVAIPRRTPNGRNQRLLNQAAQPQVPRRPMPDTRAGTNSQRPRPTAAQLPRANSQRQEKRPAVAKPFNLLETMKFMKK